MTGANDGSSWADAYVHLQHGFAAATPGDEIWLAHGTYKPDQGGGQTGGDRSATFAMPGGVALYGSFVGTETSVAGRLGTAASTILSGDLSGDDQCGVHATFAENSLHVMTVAGQAAPCLVDGLTLTGGNASNPALPNREGGGVTIVAAATTFRGCILECNLAFRGGAIHAGAGATALFDACTIRNNRASDDGGGILVETGADAMVHSCVIKGNSTNTSTPGNNSDGGGVFVAAGATGIFGSCLVAGNTANEGAGFYIGANVTISYSTIVDNHASKQGGGIFAGSMKHLSNSILWDNTDLQPGTGTDQYSIVSFGVFCNCIVQDYVPTGADCSILGSDPLFVGSGNYHLTALSPAVNAGSVAVHPPPHEDIDGEPRVLECGVDIGADESPYFPDCDGNAASDSCQIATNPSLDINGNGTLDTCECLVQNYCVTSPNSNSAVGAVIGSVGPPSVSSGQFTLTVTAAAKNSIGIFFYGPEQVQVPFGNGVRCVGAGAAGIFRLPTPVFTHPDFGDGSLPLDFSVPPAGSGPGQITPGSTWYFQFWFRDVPAGSAGFNLSDGLVVNFCP